MKIHSAIACLVILSAGAGSVSAQDIDTDGVDDAVDNCVLVANADQRDTNGDGFGNVCDADLNNDCVVNPSDLGHLRAAFLTTPGDANWDPHADLNGDDVVNPADLGLLRLGFLAAPGPGPFACQPAPNILFVIADDIAQDASAQYPDGSQKPVTPTLDGLANDGIVFENLWVNPVCTPTRGTLLTGRYGYDTGVLAVGDVLSLNETSLQSFIETNAGIDYSTAVIGKWHLAGRGMGVNLDHPNLLGIEHYAGIIGGATNDYWNWTLTENGTQTPVVDEYATTKLTDLAIDWIGQQNSPWFLWLAYNAPHPPFHTPPDGLYTTDVSQGDPDANPLPLYLAAIEAMDHELGRLLSSLSPAERANTTIVFIGDNGTPMRVYQGSGMAKNSLDQGGVQVPMIVSGQRVARSGEREDALVNGIDFFATIASLAGTGTPSYGDSVSQLELFAQDLSGPRTHAYSEGGMGGVSEWTVRNDRHKLITRANSSQELYDLIVDPGETDNLLTSDPGNSDVQEALAELNMIGNQIRD